MLLSRRANAQIIGLRPSPTTLRHKSPTGAAAPDGPTDLALFFATGRPAQRDAKQESSSFTSGVYDPELLRTMGCALDAAWATFKPTPKNTGLARLLMASAIIETIEAGAREHALLVDKATRALRAAIKEDRDALDEAPKALAAR